MDKKTNMQKFFDRLGLALATGCGVHCLLMPLLVLAFPLLAGTFFTEEAFHLGMLAVVVPATGMAAFLGCRRHRDKAVVWLLASGLVFLVAAVSVGHQVAGENGERVTTLAGVLLLAFGHIRNLRLCYPRGDRLT